MSANSSTLVAIADHGSFSAAARALYTVQSNVSSHIARLEKELGVTLVDRAHGGPDRRRRRGWSNVPAGSSTSSTTSPPTWPAATRRVGADPIGVIGTTARWLMPQLLGRSSESTRMCASIVHEGTTTTLVPSVLRGQLDAAIVHLPVDDPELVIEPLFAEDLLLLADQQHPLADTTPSTWPISTTYRSCCRPTARRCAASSTGRPHRPTSRFARRPRSTASGSSPRSRIEGFGAAIVPATAVPLAEGAFSRITVPELPRRSSPSPSVGARSRARRPWPPADAARRDPRPGRARQHGVHVGTAAFAAARQLTVQPSRPTIVQLTPPSDTRRLLSTRCPHSLRPTMVGRHAGRPATCHG